MIELFQSPNYDFIGKRKWAYIVSITITLIGIASIVAHGGLRYDIDFTGGTLAQVRFERAPSVAQIRTALGKVGLGDAVIQRFGDPNEYLIRVGLTSTTPEEVGRRLQSALASDRRSASSRSGAWNSSAPRSVATRSSRPSTRFWLAWSGSR